jgi:hypothetical protein
MAFLLAAGIEPNRPNSRGIDVHSLHKTAINDAIRNGAQMHEVREFAGHSEWHEETIRGIWAADSARRAVNPHAL